MGPRLPLLRSSTFAGLWARVVCRQEGWLPPEDAAAIGGMAAAGPAAVTGPGSSSGSPIRPPSRSPGVGRLSTQKDTRAATFWLAAVLPVWRGVASLCPIPGQSPISGASPRGAASEQRFEHRWASAHCREPSEAAHRRHRLPIADAASRSRGTTTATGSLVFLRAWRALGFAIGDAACGAPPRRFVCCRQALCQERQAAHCLGNCGRRRGQSRGASGC